MALDSPLNYRWYDEKEDEDAGAPRILCKRSLDWNEIGYRTDARSANYSSTKDKDTTHTPHCSLVGEDSRAGSL